jgi:hypothetical protein
MINKNEEMTKQAKRLQEQTTDFVNIIRGSLGKA